MTSQYYQVQIKALTNRNMVIQSTLSKADTLGTKATVRFREVSALERVQVTNTRTSKLKPGLSYSVQCSRPNGSQHTSYEFVYFIKTRDVPVIRLCYFQVFYKFVLTSGVRFERFQTKIWKKVSTVRLREVSALERVQLQRYKCNSAGIKFAVRFREVSALESVHLERVDCINIMLAIKEL